MELEPKYQEIYNQIAAAIEAGKAAKLRVTTGLFFYRHGDVVAFFAPGTVRNFKQQDRYR